MSQWDGKWWYRNPDDARGWGRHHDDDPLVLPIPDNWQAGKAYIVKNRQYALDVICSAYLNKGYRVTNPDIISFTTIDIDAASDRPRMDIHGWGHQFDISLRGYVDIPDRIIAFVAQQWRPQPGWVRVAAPPQEQLLVISPPAVQPPIIIQPPPQGRELRAITLR